MTFEVISFSDVKLIQNRLFVSSVMIVTVLQVSLMYPDVKNLKNVQKKNNFLN
jgi:hypothetical protein